MKIETKIAHAVKEGKRPAFSYHRVSTDEQAKTGSSLQYQADAGQRYADTTGLFIVHHFSAAESGYKEGRREFNEMLTLAEKHCVKDLVFKNADRLARNQLDHQRIKKLRKEKGYTIHFYESATVLDENSTAEHELFSHSMAGFAEYWSNKISQGVKAANKFKAQRGTPPGRPPFGYIYDYKEKKFSIDPEKKEIVNLIFQEYDFRGKSIQKICDMLNDAGERSPKGHRWRKAHLGYILANPVYAGFFFDRANQEHTANHETYISRDRYAERRYKMRKQFHGTRKRDTNYLFSGILRYGPTGRMLTGEMHKGQVYYSHRRPNTPMFKESEIIAAVLNTVELFRAWSKDRMTQFDTDIVTEAERIAAEICADKTPLKKSLNHKISEIKAREARLIHLYGNDLISQDTLSSEIAGLKEKRNDYELKLSKINDYDTSRVNDFLLNVSLFHKIDILGTSLFKKVLPDICDAIIIDDSISGILDKQSESNHNTVKPRITQIGGAICLNCNMQTDRQWVEKHSAKFQFRKPYDRFFNHVSSVRNRQAMLPEYNHR